MANTRSAQPDAGGGEGDWNRFVADGRVPSLKPSMMDSEQASISSRPSMDVEQPRKQNGTARRQSVRPAKQPQGARPLTRSPSKLPTSGAMRESTRIASGNSVKGAPVPRSRQSSYNLNNQGFDFGTGPAGARTSVQAAEPTSFLPEVNFDDLHNSITVGEPNLDNATRAKRGLIQTPSFPNIREERQHPRSRQSMMPPVAPEQSQPRASQFVPRQSNSRRTDGSAPSHPPGTTVPMGPPAAQATAARSNRRQSHFPTSVSTTAISKAPRKSVGPGILTQSASSYAFLQDEPQFSEHRQSTFRRRQSRHEAAASSDMGDLRNGIPQGRASRVRSQYVGQDPEMLSAQLNGGASPWATSRSPGREGPQDGTPGSAGRRMSINPAAAAGGLGARTISPTDLKRMKRLSMMQNSVSDSPPLTASDAPPPFPAQYADSPPTSAGRRKSGSLPPSSRNTPDPNRRSRHGSVTNQHVWQNMPGSARAESFSSETKSPTLKGRAETSEETRPRGVPPVPAIPKAFESPKNEQDILFANANHTSMLIHQEIESEHSQSPADYVSARSSKASYREPMRTIDTPSSIRGYTEDIQSAMKNGADTAPSRRKRDPPRLPPLNLLPLSTPTSDKIAGMQNGASVAGNGAITPPRKVTKTPTTPMTASKAAFSSRYHQKDGTAQVNIARSNTSQFINAGEYASFRPPSSAASSIKGSDKEKGRHSPFVSSSLPKATSESSVLRTKPSVDRSASTLSSDVKNSKLAGPRAQPSGSHLRRQSAIQGAAIDNESTGSSLGSNLRRKFSLTRRRSSSKVEDQPPQPPAHSSMPPPKLPASATSNSLANQGPKTNFLTSRRKSSHPDGFPKPAQASQNGESVKQVPLVRKSFEYRTLDPKARSSISGMSDKFAQANGHVRNPRPIIDNKLDRDDMVAEQEMAKLALRRKKTEIEARELDALRQRAVPVERVSPTTALRTASLNVFERGEIVDFDSVYFTGTKNAEKLVGNLQAEGANFGYDDERGDYNIVLGDHLSYRYEVVDILGKGSFGQVVRCVDHKTGGLVAVKIIRNKKRFHQQALVEVNILQKLKEWDLEGTHSMVSFTQSFYFRGHLCISTELLGMNLYEFIKIHDFRGFSIKLIRRFAKQMLNSLVLLKGKKVIHCDLKPENILLAHPAHSEIKVIDFGSSCLENEKVYTYIQSRFYRSPEVILGMNYGMPIDMWSLGCILAELLTGFPLFPGENEQEQLACIMEVFGPPDKHLIEKSTRRKLFFDSLGKPRPVVSSKGKRRRPSSKTLQSAIRCDDDAFIDFLTRCLRWDPERRLKPDEAASHEFITGIKAQAPSKTIRSITLPHLVSVSPVKRMSSTATRPLPDPNTAPGRASLAGRVREISPAKAAVPKRHSTVGGGVVGGNPAVKRQTTGGQAAPGSGLPRLGMARQVSGKQDMASAAAAMATAVSAGNHRA